MNFASIGLLNYDLALGVTSYLDKETEYFPWYAALNGLEYVGTMLEETASYGKFKVFLHLVTSFLGNVENLMTPITNHCLTV